MTGVRVASGSPPTGVGATFGGISPSGYTRRDPSSQAVVMGAPSRAMTVPSGASTSSSGVKPAR